MRPIYFDILIALILLVSALLGRRKGFILTLCGFLALFVALIGAGVLTNLLAPPLSRLAVPFIQGAMGEVLGEAGGAAYSSLDQIISQMEQSDLLRGLTDGVRQAVEQGVLDTTADAARAVTQYLAEQLTRLILFPIFFLLLMLVWTALSHILDLAFHLPGLNFLNRTAGLLLGFVRGVVIVFALCWLLKDSYLPQSVTDASILLPLLTGESRLFEFSTPHS